MTLPILPLLTRSAQRDIELDVDIIYDWLEELQLEFANAVGDAIAPDSGDGDGALRITEAPTSVVYTAGSGLSVDGVLFGHIDVNATLPDRAVSLGVFFRENGGINFKFDSSPDLPFRLVSLKIGVTYNIQVAGISANGVIGPKSSLTDVIIPTTPLDTDDPTSLVAVASYQSVILTWVEATGGSLSEYEVERAENSSFTVNSVTWVTDGSKFVDDVGLVGVTRYYRIRAISTSGSISGYTNTASATTLNVPASSIGTTQLSDLTLSSSSIVITGSGAATEVLTDSITVVHNLNKIISPSLALTAIANETATAVFTGVFLTANGLNSFTVRVTAVFVSSTAALTATLESRYR